MKLAINLDCRASLGSTPKSHCCSQLFKSGLMNYGRETVEVVSAPKGFASLLGGVKVNFLPNQSAENGAVNFAALGGKVYLMRRKSDCRVHFLLVTNSNLGLLSPLQPS